MAVQSSGSSLANYYWEIYHLMGDPSVMNYLTQASLMTVNAPSAITYGPIPSRQPHGQMPQGSPHYNFPQTWP